MQTCNYCSNSYEAPSAILIDGRQFCPHCACFCASCGAAMPRNAARRCRQVRNSYGRLDPKLYCGACFEDKRRWEPTCVEVGSECTRIGSLRTFGVEIETCRCPDYRLLCDKTIFGCKSDGSIRGMEFISPVLSGDLGLREIENFCTQARALGFRVSTSCGLHVHIGLQDLTDLQRLRVAHGYLLAKNLWAAMVSGRRKFNRYCRLNGDNGASIRLDSFDCYEDFVRCQWNRYQFINFDAFSKHQTVEMRGHQGSLTAKAIVNWTVANVNFVDAMKDLTYDEQVAYLENGDMAYNRAHFDRFIGAKAARHYRKALSTYVGSLTNANCVV
jgi:hypothetical protein